MDTSQVVVLVAKLRLGVDEDGLAEVNGDELYVNLLEAFMQGLAVFKLTEPVHPDPH